MPEKHTKKTDKRTKTIPIKKKEENDIVFGHIHDTEEHDLSKEPLQRVIKPEQNQHYELHIEAAIAPDKVKKMPAPANKRKPTKKIQKSHFTPDFVYTKPKLTTRIWNFLEWISVSALIFMVLFFAMNFSSYSSLLKSKLEKITGNFKLNPFIQQMLGDKEVEQALLPLSTSRDQDSQQIPELSLDITPPDDRIIIPRINQNVPVLKVSTENLIKRDWGALEDEIQEALKYGVVHYPGTAQAGEDGNVVITGHSSYFPWDPGRFKDVFALLHEVIIGDIIIVYHNQEKLLYEVYEKKVVLPDQVEVLTQAGEDRLTLLTCTPVGTNLKRLVIFAKPTHGAR